MRILILLLIPVIGMSQKVYSLQECIDIAIKNNLELNFRQYSIDRTKQDLSQAKSDRLPNVNGSASQRVSFGRDVNPTSNDFAQNVRSYNMSLSSSVDIFNGFRKTNTIERIQENLAAGKFDLEDAKNEIRLNVIQLYMQLMLSQAKIQQADIRIDQSEIQLSRIQKMIEAGSSSLVDKFQIESQLADDQFNKVSTTNNISQTKLNLLQLMNLPFNEDFEIEMIDVENISSTPLISNTQELFDGLVTKFPAMKAADTRISASKLNTKIAKSGYYPSLGASAGIFSQSSSIPFDPFYEQWEQNFNQSLGLRLDVPIFNNKRVSRNVQIAKINELEAKNNKKVTSQSLRRELEKITLDAELALKRLEAAETKLNASQKTFNAVEKRYETGFENYFAFAQTRNNFNLSSIIYLEAKYDYVFKKKIIEFYEGLM